MSTVSYVGAAIGGEPFMIEEFKRAMSKASISDKGDILEKFKIIKIQPDFNVFAFYDSEYLWSNHEEETWEHLTRIANRLNLSWVFLCAGEQVTDAECDNNFALLGDNFDCRISNLFEFEHSVRIAPELSRKFY